MRYFYLVLGVVVALSTQTFRADAAASASSHCDVADVGRVDTPRDLVLAYGSSVRWQPENKACAFYARGLILQLLGDSNAAIADYTRAVGWMDSLGEAYAARGDVYESLGEHEKAKADYVQARRLSQNNAATLNSICWERAKRGYPLALALNDCNAATSLNPDLWSAWDSRCLVNFRLGNFAAAISDCDKAIDRWRDETWDVKAATWLPARSRYVRGLAKIRIGNIEEGNTDIAAAKDVYPGVAKKYAEFGVTQ